MTRSNPITSLASAAVMPLTAPAVVARGGKWRRDRGGAEDLERRVGDRRCREQKPRIDPGRLHRTEPPSSGGGYSSVARAPEGRCSCARPRSCTGPSRSGMQRLDPEVLGAHLGRLLRTASALCDSRESAEDLVQETVASKTSRGRGGCAGGEAAYLDASLRNTFVTSTRTAARRPRAVTPLEGFDPTDVRIDGRPEEAVIIGQVFPAIARLPESFRLALVAVDIAGLSYGEAARVLGAPEATITTRLYRARQRVARELDPERAIRRSPIEGQPKGLRSSADGTEHTVGRRRLA